VDAANEAGVEPVLLCNPEENANVGSVITAELVQQLREFMTTYRDRVDGIASYDLCAASAVHAAMACGLRVRRT
jgi:hypothetical protein